MSAKKPPPRPPLPRSSTARSGQPTGVAPEKSLRNPFSSISIRYSSSNKESDSDEEISIVRKENSKVPDPNELRQEIGGEDGEDGFFNVTKRVCEQVGSANTSQPEKYKYAEGTSNTKQNSSGTGLNLASKSHSTQELRETPDRRSAVTKQSTWPSYSRNEDSDSVIMKFLRGREREREQGNEGKADSLKEGLSLSEKEESDAGSRPCKSHADDGSESKLKAHHQRSRSPSPFRILNRDRQVESAGDQEKPKSSAGISLSSLLASIAKDEVHGETEEKISDTEEIESNADIVSEIPSPDLLFNFDHYNEASRESGARLLSRPILDKSPQFANFCFCSLLVYIYFITSSPPFISGLVLGSLLAYLGGCAFLWLFCPEDTLAERYEKELLEYEGRLARTPRPEYKYVDPGLLVKRNVLEASIQLVNYKKKGFVTSNNENKILSFITSQMILEV